MGPPSLLFDSLPVRVDHSSDNSAIPAILPLSAFPDKRLFDETVDYPVISVATRDTAAAKQRLRDYIPAKRKDIFPDGDDRRKILLMPNVSMEEVAARMAGQAIAAADEPQVASRSGPAEEEDQQNGPSSGNKPKSKKPKKKKHKATSDGSIEFTIPTTEPTMRLVRTYDDQSTDEILRKLLLPSATIREIPSAVEQVGHIAHLNLRDELLPYQYWIGQILLDKHGSNLKTVVNKTSSIATVYRTFPMTVIAGDDGIGWSVTTVHEHNCFFRLDYQTVYWNSRLSHEHERLVQEIVETRHYNVVADCMAGVGPFAIPLAKRGVTVHANDLNEESVKYLHMNIKLNKIPADNEGKSSRLVHVYNQDARQFIKEVFTAQPSIDCAILNLPASAPEFLDAFADVLSPNVHLYVYSFAPKNDANQAVERCRAALGEQRRQDLIDLSIHTVRDVSPGKNMYCISFRLSNKKVKTDTSALNE